MVRDDDASLCVTWSLGACFALYGALSRWPPPAVQGFCWSRNACRLRWFQDDAWWRITGALPSAGATIALGMCRIRHLRDHTRNPTQVSLMALLSGIQVFAMGAYSLAGVKGQDCLGLRCVDLFPLAALRSSKAAVRHTR